MCDILGIKNSRDAYTRLAADEKATVGLTDGGGNNASGIQPVQFTVIFETSLYMLIII